MRTIKFRGKSLADGSWLYGDLLQEEGKVHIYNGKRGPYYTVDPDTVGQFAGWQDKTGKDIYENDIVKRGKYIGTVIYAAPSFHLDTGYWAPLRLVGNCTVIGNTTDNPDLLKGDKS